MDTTQPTKKFIESLWTKEMQEILDNDTKRMEQLNREKLQKEIEKQDKRLKQIIKVIKDMKPAEIAEVIYASEKEIEKQEETIKALRQDRKALERVEKIIVDYFGYDRY